MSSSATGSSFSSSFLGCPVYLNDKSNRREWDRHSVLMYSSQWSCFHGSITAQWQHRMNMVRLGRSVKPRCQCRCSRAMWIGLGCVLYVRAGHREVCAGTASIYLLCWEEGNESMTGVFWYGSTGSKIINSCRVHTASRLSFQGSTELRPVFRHSLTAVTAVETVVANSDS